MSIFFTAAAVAIFTGVFFFEPAVVIDGLRKGLTVCGMSIIPSLLPFAVVSDFLVRSGFSRVVGGKISPVTQKLFRLPGAAGCAIIMSLVGGFPIGAKMTAQLIEGGEITSVQGRRMMIFCVNAGPAFVIGTVGTAMLASRKAGLILFVSMTITSVLVGIMSRFFADTEDEISEKKAIDFNAGVLTESVRSSVNTMLEICGWILLFSGLNAVIIRLPVGEAAGVWLTMLNEVTNGCMCASGRFPTCILALVLGWSGLAVHFQLLPYLKKMNMKITRFWMGRLIIGGVATAVAWLLFRIFPCEISVFNSATGLVSKPYSVSVPAAVGMIVLSVLMLVDLKPCTKEKGVI